MKRIFILYLIFFTCQTAVSQWSTYSGTTPPSVYTNGNAAATNSGQTSFSMLWYDNAVIWKYGNWSNGLRFGSATDLGATNWNETMRLMDNGNVGIGTGSPGNKLEIKTTADVDGLKIGFNGTGFVRLHPNSLHSLAYNNIVVNGDAGLIYGGTNVDSNAFGFVIGPWSSGTRGLRLDRYGNLGINTNTTQGYQLAVNGSAIFTSAWVKPYSNWPDFVFRHDYHLPPLDSLSSYIQAHHHLPDVPSADSIQKSGFDLGGTQAVLLKKIEELTLYVIDQKKEIDALKEKNDQLMMQQQRIDRLEKALEQLTGKQPINYSNPRP